MKNRKKIIYGFWGLFLCSMACVSCKQAITPKPHGYIRIDMPEKNFQKFDAPDYPYTFEYPAFGQIVPDTASRGWEPYWINIQFPEYKATLHISYKKVNKNLAEILDDTYSFVYRHVIKADAIIENPFVNRENKTYGMLYEIGGPAASTVQFYLTDSTANFLRGALYFNVTPNRDSLNPYIDYFTEDIQYLMQTLTWKK